MEKKALFAVAFISVLLFSAAEAFFVKSTQANPYHREAYGTEVPPPAGTQPPAIIIHTPQNGSIYPKNLNLTFDVIVPKTNGDKSLDAVTELYYKGSWDTNEIKINQYNEWGYQKSIGDNASFSIDLSGVRGGNHSLTIYAVGGGSYNTREEFDAGSYTMIYYYESFEMTGFSTVSFTKDLVSPRISFLSPPNGTYVTSDVKLDFIVSEDVSQILFSLDGKENQTVSDSLTLTSLAEGAHNVTLYATDLAGNTAAPQTLFFSVDLPEPFPTMPVAFASIAPVALVAVGLVMYFRKHKR